MRYTTLLFDLDHTLLDSDESERQAYAHTMATIRLDEPAAHFERYVTINREMWHAVEAGDIRPADVRHLRFERFIAELGLDADPHDMADAFVWGLASHGDLYAGAREVLAELTGRVQLGLVTNGLSFVQRTRIDRLDLAQYFRTVTISEEVAVTKPRPEIFDITVEALGDPVRSSVLIVGDSLTSDMQGGANAGIATCWYDRHGHNGAAPDIVTHHITDLRDIVSLL